MKINDLFTILCYNKPIIPKKGDEAVFKNFKKYSKGKKIRTIVILVLILGIAGTIGYEVFKPDPLPEYELVTAEKGSISQTFTATGTVESGNPSVYNILDGVEVLEVKVKVGDKVKRGDELATFDTSALSSQLNELRSEYNQALSRYNKASSSSSEASSNLKDTNSEISKLEKKISALEKDIEKTREKEKEQLNLPESVEDIKYEGKTYTPEQIEAITQQILENAGTQEQVDQMIAALNSAESNASSNQLSPEELADRLKDTSAGKSLELVQLQTQLTSLKTQKTYFEMQSGDTVAKAFKAVADIKQKEYEQLAETVEALDKGWVAENNGIVTKVNITQGEVFSSAKQQSASNADFSEILNMIGGGGNVDLTSIISQLTSASSNETVGIQIDNYDSFIATFNVGKYDLLSLKVGQKAKVVSLDSEYDGVVDYVSATASESTGLDISSITSSLTGGTNSSNTALAKVKILKPDEKVIIGFDVDISVILGEIDDVIILPVEALRFENGEKYVFVYNEETKTVEKRTVQLGSSEDTKYEIASGIKEGEKIIKNPLSALKDGDKIAVVKG